MSRPSLRAVAKRLLRALKSEQYAFWRRRQVRPDVVFYESFAGNGMLCNPEAIFRALLADPEFAALNHVWALRSKRENRGVVKEFARHPRVRFVRVGSSAYLRALATSGYLVNNATFPPEFGKRAGQVYLNTWHGTPLKRMGYDIGDPPSRVANVVRNFLSADYLLAANEFMVERMYGKAHLLDGIYPGQIICEGYPRIDRQVLDAAGRDAALARLADAGITLGGRSLILYAPTWKGTNFNRPEDDADVLFERLAELNAGVDQSKYLVVLKTHQVVSRYAAHRPELRGLLVPNEIPTNVVLGVTDILVTDYSSIFFDFLPTERPIVFLTPDAEDYADYRGLYLDQSEWPGPIAHTVADAVFELRSLAESGPSASVLARAHAARQRFCPWEHGGATERVVDVVFRGRTRGHRIERLQSHQRSSVLLYAGGMRPNGITSSLLNLVDAIDRDRFDVTVVFPNSYVRAVVAKQRELPVGVRAMARVGGMPGSKLAHLSRRVSHSRGAMGAHATDPVQRGLWDDEWRRCFGDARFDHVIDFSGYSAFWATLLLHAPGAHRSIWMHNDLAADAHRAVHGRRRNLRDLRAVFSLYREYNELVSVSPALREINAHSLGDRASVDQFVFARNLIGAQRVIDGAEQDLVASATSVATGEVAPWALELADPGKHVPTFVSVGRLSVEKNHERLIRAFALVHEQNPSTRLVLVGSGPLRNDLEQVVASLGLGDFVLFTGQRANPYSVMAASDCFVLSSDYEGQPMVLLEAMTLGLPIVTVGFGSVRDALPPGFGRVTDSTSEALADGMNAFLRGEVPTPRFDATEYNAEAMTEFLGAIKAKPWASPVASGR